MENFTDTTRTSSEAVAAMAIVLPFGTLALLSGEVIETVGGWSDDTVTIAGEDPVSLPAWLASPE